LVSVRHVVFRIILLAIGCAIAVVIGEALLEVRDRAEEETPASDGSTAEVVTREGEAESRVQAATTVYHSTPWSVVLPSRTVDMQAMVEAFSWDYRTDAKANSHGFRTAEYTIARPPETFRVVVVGDSITWGQGVRREQTFAALLEDRLDEDLQDAGIDAEVIALGTCGSRFVDGYLRLRAHAEQLEPDLVIYQFFVNDLEYLISHRRPEVLSMLEQSSNLLQAVRAVVDRDEFWDLARAYTDSDSIEWRLFLEVLEAFRAWHGRLRIPLVVVSFPPIDVRRDGGNFDGWTELAPYRETLDRPLAEMRRAGLPVLDLVDELEAKAGRRYLSVSERDGHPNGLAHEIAAEALLEFLGETGLVPGDASELRPAGTSWAAESSLRQEAADRWDELNQDYEPQRQLFFRLLELAPANPWLNMQVAHLGHQMGDAALSCRYFEALVDLAPDIASPWYQISLCAQDHEMRLGAFRRMIERVPEHAPTIEEIMKTHAYEGDTLEACRSAVELGRYARYPEQFTRAADFFKEHDCADHGLDFWP